MPDPETTQQVSGGGPDEPTLVTEARRWVTECGEPYRAETMDALLDGNEIALHWAAKVLAAQDLIESLVQYVDELLAQREQSRRVARRMADEQPSPEEIVRRHEAGVEAAARALHDDDIRERAVDLSYPECGDHYRSRVAIVLAAYTAITSPPPKGAQRA